MTSARLTRPLVVGAVALTTLFSTTIGLTGLTGPAVAASPDSLISSSTPDLGPNVILFDPSMPQASIQATLDSIATQQVPNQFGTQRYSLLFKPGVYGSAATPLIFQVGFYTEVAGLGQSPGDVTINGSIDSYNQCDANGCTALDNFWRSVSNLTIAVAGGSGCQTDTEFWAVSQAAPMRRVNVTGGGLSFMDYCSAGPQYASGGFLSDSSAGTVVNGSQQQFLTKDSTIASWSNGVWNSVFAGVTGAPAQSYPTPPYTTLDKDQESREKPYLYLDASGGENVFVPALRINAVGTSWANGPTAGTSIPIKKFFVTRPSDSATTINNALDAGQNLLFTPGVYQINKTIDVSRPNTVVLGLGFATLIPQHGVVAMKVASVPGVKVAGLLFDAGTVNSPNLLQVGTPDTQNLPTNQRRKLSDANNPTTLSDVFFRVGGATLGKVTTALTVNSDNTLMDDLWVWRADHGNAGTVGWTVNTANQGVVVNGDHVTATGLFVEHFQKYDVTWNGENGKVVFFQNEMPYDAPNQAAWQHNGVNGFAAIHVASDVETFEGWGLGSYIFTNVDPTLHSASGFEVPVTPGVQLHDVFTISLNAAGTIDHVVNSTGGPVTPTVQGPSSVVSFP
jgi:hypothetical protein